MSSNEHTGARLVTKPSTQAYQENLENIFPPRPLRRALFDAHNEATANDYLTEQGEKFSDYEFLVQFEFGHIAIYSRKAKG